MPSLNLLLKSSCVNNAFEHRSCPCFAHEDYSHQSHGLRPLSANGLNRSRGRGGFDQASERLTTRILFRKLRSEAFHLVSQPEQSHERFPREISPLRQRMLEDMRLRKLAPGTQTGYVRAVRKLAGYLRRPPDTATVEDLRNFQLHLVDQGTSPITLNATITGLKFFFDVTLDRSELMSKMKPVFVPRTLQVVLSREEVSFAHRGDQELEASDGPLSCLWCRTCANEVISLKVGDVDSTRMTLRIQQGKGGKDRYAMLSPVMLERLRTWWRVARAKARCSTVVGCFRD